MGIFERVGFGLILYLTISIMSMMPLGLIGGTLGVIFFITLQVFGVLAFISIVMNK